MCGGLMNCLLGPSLKTWMPLMKQHDMNPDGDHVDLVLLLLVSILRLLNV